VAMQLTRNIFRCIFCKRWAVDQDDFFKIHSYINLMLKQEHLFLKIANKCCSVSKSKLLRISMYSQLLSSAKRLLIIPLL
jgi:hypothetical protein